MGLCKGGVNILINKDLGPKEVDETFKNFIDNHYEDIRKVASAYGDVINTVNQRNKQFIDSVINEKTEQVAKDLKIDIEELASATREDNTLTDEQLQKIADAFEENKENSEELKTIAELPSNNGVEESDPEEVEEGEFKNLNMKSDPETGIKSILGDADDLLNTESFDEMLERINNEELEFGNSTVESISEGNGARVIDAEKCISCGTCAAECPAEAIIEE